MKQEVYTQTEIAKVININESIVSRKLRRNADGTSGLPYFDQNTAQTYKCHPALGAGSPNHTVRNLSGYYEVKPVLLG